jgi:hypothetical protein
MNIDKKQGLLEDNRYERFLSAMLLKGTFCKYQGFHDRSTQMPKKGLLVLFLFFEKYDDHQAL